MSIEKNWENKKDIKIKAEAKYEKFEGNYTGTKSNASIGVRIEVNGKIFHTTVWDVGGGKPERKLEICKKFFENFAEQYGYVPGTFSYSEIREWGINVGEIKGKISRYGDIKKEHLKISFIKGFNKKRQCEQWQVRREGTLYVLDDFPVGYSQEEGDIPVEVTKDLGGIKIVKRIRSF
ncbi:hypothetical protein A2303_03605 [Candidatus Falkowbacteria bacterium RIFOXYB2_FULL_47_14]|uniref:Uncharacterized protein n=1 Tax=Candidatus Falkowbacteria bacterium RIFOXYA2_FULL_47_19 TaxID=1797994 RepID=A0A1F5SHR1_9BACT|nr:MAG: hypothetical protein A2227_03150 [Candidatus Falkowbacteria bacterium RIFOXYA2_FULL_47_19]OGF36691.1 MAG: hypothetical protein A2468_02615 [Candidatus Falkowbacteria bacterium RIFOXYC2_FULL_46_15]OGF42485.1 MAG: hypothetical protein A2303_03605 [Candidatus Falkowbacteria bacterium RIFOXYB2_FULL_47_14]